MKDTKIQKKPILVIAGGVLVFLAVLVFFRSPSIQRFFGVQAKINSQGAYAFKDESSNSTTASLETDQTDSNRVHSPGTNVRNSDGSIWLITNVGTRRKYTSTAAYNSYPFNKTVRIATMNKADLGLRTGAPILPMEGRPYVETSGPNSGQVYLISGNNKHPFASATVFQGMGF